MTATTPTPLDITLAQTPAVHERWASYSQLTTHRACPQRWTYGYLRRIETDPSTDVTVERDFGHWWHLLRAVDSLERGRALATLRYLPSSRLSSTDDGPTLAPHTATTRDVYEAAVAWWRTQRSSVKDEWDARLGGQLPARLRALDDRWHDRWDAERRHEHPLGVEVRWTRALPPSVSGEDPMTTLVGFIDEAYLDTRRGIVVVRDYKTSTQMPAATVADDMMDSQLQFYAWGASPVITTWGSGPVRATAYDRIRTAMPKAPSVTQAGSLSKSTTDYDLATYREWAKDGVPFPGRKKDGSDAGVYLEDPEVVARLSTLDSRNDWQQRTLTPLNANLIRAHLRAATDTALDQRRTQERAERTGEAARNLSKACRWCDFVKLCRAEMIGGSDGSYDLAELGLRVKPNAPRAR